MKGLLCELARAQEDTALSRGERLPDGGGGVRGLLGAEVIHAERFCRPSGARHSYAHISPRLTPWALSLYICDEMNDERRETVEDECLSPRPLGGEGGPQPAHSPAGAGRVRGSKP
jgi:hypothetical protein